MITYSRDNSLQNIAISLATADIEELDDRWKSLSGSQQTGCLFVSLIHFGMRGWAAFLIDRTDQ